MALASPECVQVAHLDINATRTKSLYTLLQPVTVPPNSSRARFTNWGRTYRCAPLAVFEPHTEEQCQLVLELARREGKRVRFSGVGHSPSDLACTSDFMLNILNLNKVLEVNTDKSYVVAQSGITIKDLHKHLEDYGLAMSNLGSISDSTVAGVITTPTHGSGITYGVLATHVLSLSLLLADGRKVTCSATENADLFHATLCGLGATGLILSVKIQVERTFRLKEVQESIGFDDFINRFDQMVHSAEHTRFWWFAQNGMVRTSVADRTYDKEDPAGSWLWHQFFGHHVVEFLLFIGRFFLFVNTWTAIFAEWLIRGTTKGVDKAHLIFNVDCRYPQYTTEWAVPYQNAKRCLLELRAWLDEELADPDGLRPHFPVEIRFTEADDIWMSPGYKQRMCWIGIVQYKPYRFNVPYARLFSRYESIVSRHGGKPHWAKAHALRPADLQKLYPKFGDYVKVLDDVDPRGVFRNEYVRRHIYGEMTPDVHARVFKKSVGLATGPRHGL